MILYLHGFRSSPLSFKARLLQERMQALGLADQYCCPQLPASPRAAAVLMEELVAGVPVEQLCLIGSSLGGYYATWLAEKTGCRAVLLNPAVSPLRDLSRHVGVMPAWHSDEPFEFKQAYLDELRALEVPALTEPARYFLIAATGDEVLDWREMRDRYALARQRIIQGSDHGLSDFAGYMDDVLAFCGVETKPS
ncbi:MAG: alpha/beta fold hydrolase [Paucimonas sp.]|nr:alpha/beta fold hydrolase [Paucimonas sp.]